MLLVRLQRAAIAALCFFTLAVLTATAAMAAHGNHITAYAWFDDPSNAMTLTEVKQQEFKPYDGFLSRGFGHSTTWVRLRIDPHVSPTNQRPGANSLILRIRPLYLDELELFDPLDQSNQRRLTGDRYPSRAAEYQSLNFNFVIPRGDAPRDVYLRMRSTSTRLMQIEAFHLSDLQRTDRIQQLLYGLYLSLVGLFFVWAAISWLTTRDPVISAFLVTQFFALVLGASIFGYTRDFLGAVLNPSLIDQLTSFCSIMIVISAGFFYLRFWEEYKPARWQTRVLQLSLGVGIINFVVLIAYDTTLALNINMMLIFVLPIVTFLMALSAKGWDAPNPADRALVPHWLILFYFGTNLAVLLLGALPGLGLAKGGAYSIYVGLMHGIINGAFAVGILQYRSYLISQKRANLAMELEMAQQQIKQERLFREERERLLAMLAHELRTPLATVRMLLGREQDLDSRVIGQIKQSVREMNAVIERSLQVNQLEESTTPLDIVEFDAVGELTELINALDSTKGKVGLRAPASLRILTDRTLFRIVMSNLIDNAVKYRADGSPIDVVVELRQDATQVEFMIENTPGSAGFPDPRKLFSKYYRSPMAQRQTGSGLGMYLVKGLLRSLRGTIEYRPFQEKIRFIVCLPVSLS